MTSLPTVLTTKAIAALQPRNATYEVADATERGLRVRIHPSGAKSFIWRFSIQNRDRVMTLSAQTLADARREVREARVLRDRGEDPATTKRLSRETVAKEQAQALKIAIDPDDAIEKVLETYIARHAGKLRSEETLRIYRRVVAPAWRGRRIGEITKRDVIALLDAIVDRGAAVHANRVRSRLSTFFKWCMSRDLIEQNPCASVARPTKESPEIERSTTMRLCCCGRRLFQSVGLSGQLSSFSF